MTDNEITKALKCCGRKHNEKNDTHCKECHFKSYLPCVAFLCDRTIDLINRQKAEIERLNEKYSRMKFNLESLLAERADHTEAIKEFSSRIERVLSLHPAQAKYYYEIKKEYIKEKQKDER